MKGLTLVETLIAMGIASVVGALLLVIIVNSSGLFYKESSTVEQGLGINDALGKLRDSIKQSSGIASSFTSGSTTYTSGPSQIVVKVASVDSSGNLISDTFDHFIFFQDQNQMRFKLFPDPLSSRQSQDQIFSTNVDNLLIQYFDAQNPSQETTPSVAVKVRISLTLKQKSGAEYVINIATSEANLRND